jgi:hypothetical protein
MDLHFWYSLPSLARWAIVVIGFMFFMMSWDAMWDQIDRDKRPQEEERIKAIAHAVAQELRK